MTNIINQFEILSKLNNEFVKNIKILCVFDPINSDAIIVTKNDQVYAFEQNKNKRLCSNSESSNNQLHIIEQLCYKEIFDFSHGLSFVLGLTRNGQIYSWGNNDFGQLANVTDMDSSLTKYIDSLSDEHIIEISCGAYHSLALSQTGKVYAWGHNKFGQTGNRDHTNQLTPIRVNGFDDEIVIAISCGFDHSLALTESGRVFCWGSNEFGQLGVDGMSESSEPIPVRVENNNNQSTTFMRIACGLHHSLILSRGKEIYAFGRNNCGQLGIGHDSNQYSPVKVINEKPDFIDIAAHFHSDISIAFSDKGLYFIWGKCGQKVVFVPEKTGLESFNSVFAFYLKITHKPIHMTHDSIESFETTEQNGKYEREFAELGLISNGNFGIVCKAKNRNEEQVYAIKKVPIKNEFIDRTLNELKIMSKVKSDYVVKFMSAWIEDNYIKVADFLKGEMSSGHSVFDPYSPKLLHIQMELCSETLKQTLNKMNIESNIKPNELLTPIDYYIASELFFEILESVNYLHTQNPPIIHRDLKPTNILITNGPNSRFVKIADFGLATAHEFDDQSHSQRTGSLKYMAQEVLKTRKYDTKADMYSLGVMSLEIFHIEISSFNAIGLRNDSLLKNKYTNAYKLANDLMSTKMIDRPDCDKILSNSKNWKLSIDQLENYSEFKQMKSCLGNSESFDNNFHKFFIKTKMHSNEQNKANAKKSILKLFSKS